jgi:hypothetical protein
MACGTGFYEVRGKGVNQLADNMAEFAGWVKPVRAGEVCNPGWPIGPGCEADQGFNSGQREEGRRRIGPRHAIWPNA